VITTREVAERCRVVPETVRRWRREGRLLPSARVPKGYLYDEAAVQAFMRTPLEAPESTVVRDQLNAILSRRVG
jgi:excisionase family DNA binding protein